MSFGFKSSNNNSNTKNSMVIVIVKIIVIVVVPMSRWQLLEGAPDIAHVDSNQCWEAGRCVPFTEDSQHGLYASRPQWHAGLNNWNKSVGLDGTCCTLC